MRVLWLRPSKGDEISVRRQRIAEHLEEKGIKADIVDVSGSDVFYAVKTALTGDYDVILGNVRMGLYVGYPLARALGTPFVADVSDPISDISDLPGPLFRFFEWYEWAVLARADARMFTYRETLEEARRRGIDGIQVPNAVDFERFAYPEADAVEESASILDAEGVDRERPIAMYIGGFSEEYHIVDIIDAARTTPDWEFVFVGLGEQEELVKQVASELDNVSYPGAFEYRLIPGFLAHAMVGFCFKDAEQPLKINEYGAAGLVAIAQAGELSERFTDEEVCFVDPTGDRIHDALTTLAADRDLARRFGDRLQARAEEVSWGEIAAQYYEVLHEITGEYHTS